MHASARTWRSEALGAHRRGRVIALHPLFATDVEPALWRPHNPQWSRLPDGQLPFRMLGTEVQVAGGVPDERRLADPRLTPNE
jgi:hypothetical protein